MHEIPRGEVSRAHKRIFLRPQDVERAQQIADSRSVLAPTARVLAARGFEVGTDLDRFITPTLQEGLLPPSALLNLDRACEEVAQVMLNGGSIAVCSDFDVDGLSGAAQLMLFFQTQGIRALSFVPDRFCEGYGLNRRMIEEAASEGCTLLISVDFGTKNEQELLYARTLGMKTVVIDHHHVGDGPPTGDVFVNPHQPGCGFANGTLCASGLCWYFIVALKNHLKLSVPCDPREYLELACLGTICDMVPLIGVNRVIAKRGLEALARTTRPGLLALKSLLGIKRDVKGHDIGFGIGPRINAAGRLVHGSLVIQLLTTNSSELAATLAKKLHSLNEERQGIERRVKESATALVEKHRTIPWGITVWDSSYHTGVIGIVAQRLTEQFHRPAAVMGQDKEGLYKGSVRGIKGYSVVKALEKLSPFLVKFGGHDGAGGFAIEAAHLERFQEAFAEEAFIQVGSQEGFVPIVEVDTEVCLSEMKLDLVEELHTLAPFGVGNKAPLLLARNVEVVATREIKGTHLHVTMRGDGRSIEGILWRERSHPHITVGKKIDLAFKLERNDFRGFASLQANIQAAEVCNGR